MLWASCSACMDAARSPSMCSVARPPADEKPATAYRFAGPVRESSTPYAGIVPSPTACRRTRTVPQFRRDQKELIAIAQDFVILWATQIGIEAGASLLGFQHPQTASACWTELRAAFRLAARSMPVYSVPRNWASSRLVTNCWSRTSDASPISLDTQLVADRLQERLARARAAFHMGPRRQESSMPSPGRGRAFDQSLAATARRALSNQLLPLLPHARATHVALGERSISRCRSSTLFHQCHVQLATQRDSLCQEMKQHDAH